MNYLASIPLGRLIGMLEHGYSVRAAAAYAPCSKVTAGQVLGELKVVGRALNCGCGKPRHRGWCSWRYQQSPKRQAWLARVQYPGL